LISVKRVEKGGGVECGSGNAEGGKKGAVVRGGKECGSGNAEGGKGLKAQS
jgi:hypothetical protein